jgi:hypothetical protein
MQLKLERGKVHNLIGLWEKSITQTKLTERIIVYEHLPFYEEDSFLGLQTLPQHGLKHP